MTESDLKLSVGLGLWASCPWICRVQQHPASRLSVTLRTRETGVRHHFPLTHGDPGTMCIWLPNWKDHNPGILTLAPGVSPGPASVQGPTAFWHEPINH